MDRVISTIAGALLFFWFTAGLAESIGSIPFYIIVAIVIGMMGYDAYQTVLEWKHSNKAK